MQYKSILSAVKSSGAFALTGGRIFVMRVPQGEVFPWVRLTVGNSPEYCKDGRGVDINDLQVDIVATTHEECKTIAEVIQAKLELPAENTYEGHTFTATLTNEIPDFDDELDVNRIIQEYQIRIT